MERFSEHSGVSFRLPKKSVIGWPLTNGKKSRPWKISGLPDVLDTPLRGSNGSLLGWVVKVNLLGALATVEFFYSLFFRLCLLPDRCAKLVLSVQKSRGQGGN